jgi:hypothetical protein
MSEPQLLPDAPAPLEGEPVPRPVAVGDTVRFNTPSRQDLNGNSPMTLKDVDKATGLATLSRQGVELEFDIPITLANLIAVSPPIEAPTPPPEVPVVPDEQPVNP